MSSTIVQTTENTCKPLKGKYDGRGKYDRKNSAFASGIKPGPKPEWAKHLTRNTAALVLKHIDSKAMWLELLTHKDAKFRFEVLRYLTDRLEGKAFVAINPLESKAPSVLNQDNRLQVSIQQLLPSAKPKKQRKVITAQLLEENNPIQARTQATPPSEK